MTRGRDGREPTAGVSGRSIVDDAVSDSGDARFAVILGATSLVGRHLAERLTNRGFTGWCLTRGPESAPFDVPAGFTWRVLVDDGPDPRQFTDLGA